MMHLTSSSKSRKRRSARMRHMGVSRPGIAAFSVSFALAMGLVWQDANANWEFKPSVGVGATQTNNINLAVDSAAEDELVFEINPAFTLNNNSRAWQASVDYMMENLLFTRDSSANETFHSLAATSLSHIIQDELTLGLSSRFYQQIIDPERSVRYSNISTSGNFSDTWVNSISPTWVHQLGSSLVTRVMYRYSMTDFLDRADDGRQLNDVTTQTVNAGFGSQRQAGRPIWNVEYSYQRAEPDMAREFEYERVAATGEYPLSGSSALLAEVGAESDILTDPSVPGLDESFGELGLRWVKGERTSIELAVGHRVFGTTYRGSVNHATRRLGLSASYGEDVSTFALSQINEGSFAFYNTNEIGDPLLGIDDRVFVSKALDATATWTMPKGEVRVSAYRNRREFLNAGGDKSELQGVSGGVTRTLGPRTDVNFNFVWYRTEPGGNEPDGFELSNISAGATRTIGKSLSARVELRQAKRSADMFGREFEEIAASLFVNWAPAR